MTSKERVLKTLRFEKTDRAPFAVLNGQMWIAARHGLTMASMLDLPDAGAQLLVDAYREIGTEIMTSGCAAAWPMMEVMGGCVEMNVHRADGGRQELREHRTMRVVQIIHGSASFRQRIAGRLPLSSSDPGRPHGGVSGTDTQDNSLYQR